MRTKRLMLIVLCCLGLGSGLLTLAGEGGEEVRKPDLAPAEKLLQPRAVSLTPGIFPFDASALPGGPGFLDRPEAGVAAPGLEIQGAGNPRNLALMDSWITSDYMPGPNVTDIVWYDYEDLYLLGFFYTDKSRPVKATLIVLNESKREVFRDSYQEDVVADDIYGVGWNIGYLDEGGYLVKLKLKQGKKIVKTTFWVAVFQDTLVVH